MMPYILSPAIKENSEGMWMEGPGYQKKSIYQILPGKLPPVNYEEHIFRPHSLTHAEAPLHVDKNGTDVSSFFSDRNFFYGGCVLIRLPGNNYKLIDSEKNLYHWEVSKTEIEVSMNKILGQKKFPGKILLTTDFYPKNKDGYHDPNYVLTLSQAAADYLVQLENFNLYGTSWKSSDFNPGSPERPIHKTLFRKAIVLELLDLELVPEGVYFYTGAPLRISGASESPICPILFEYHEITSF